MVMLLGIMYDAICCMDSLQGMLHDLPLLNAPIMPVLSPHTVTWQSLKPQSTNIRTASSRAMVSAHPMSLPAMFHSWMSLQDAHWSPITTSLPQFMDASTHMSGSTGCLGIRVHGLHGMSKVTTHQHRHSYMGFRTWCHVYSLGNFERKDDIGKRN